MAFPLQRYTLLTRTILCLLLIGIISGPAQAVRKKPVTSQASKKPTISLHKKRGGIILRATGLNMEGVGSKKTKTVSRLEIKVIPSVARKLISAYTVGGTGIHISNKAKVSRAGLPNASARLHREFHAAGWFSRALKIHDPYTAGHVNRVSMYAWAIGEAMGMDKGELLKLSLASRLHDIGKLGVSRFILNGTRPTLTSLGQTQINLHPEIGAGLLELVPSLRPLLPSIRSHHEAVDGSGYPFRRRGGQIPRMGRIMAVADAFDAMTSNRSYQRSKTAAQAMATLKRLSGVKWDAEVVEAFANILPTSHRAQEALRRGQQDHTHQ